MIDLSKVSKAVQKFVEEVAKTEGNKRKVDTKQEHDKLASYLAGNQDMNVHEKEFIQGFMIEFENTERAKEEKDFEENVTQSVKQAVKKIAKRMANKKQIDTDDEAQSLLNMLKNTRGDLNKADLEYIRRALINAGYGKLLEENTQTEETPKELPLPPTMEEENIAAPKEETTQPETKENNPPTSGNSNSANTPVRNPHKPPHTKKLPKSSNSPKPKPIQSEPNIPKKTSPAPAAKKPTISERGRTDGIGLAQNLAHQLDNRIVDNKKMKNILLQVNKENAYSFFKAFNSTTHSQVNEKVFNVSDMFNKIGYRDTARAMKALLDQAKSFGLEKTPQYKALADNINFINQRVAGNPNVDPEGKEAQNSDKAINNLLVLMGKTMA